MIPFNEYIFCLRENTVKYFACFVSFSSHKNPMRKVLLTYLFDI